MFQAVLWGIGAAGTGAWHCGEAATDEDDAVGFLSWSRIREWRGSDRLLRRPNDAAALTLAHS